MAGSAALAQPYVPPSPFGDEHQGNTVIRKEEGQTVDTDGNQRPDIKAYFEGTPLGIWLRERSTISFTLAAMHNDSLTPDTVFRVDLELSKRHRDPIALYGAPGIANFYRGSITAEGVKAHHRRVYESIEDSIDVHLIGSSGGPRIAFVVRPGGDPSDIELSFSGQDSLGIDWEGDLKIYLEDKWIELKQAFAYQVDANDNIIPVNWTGGYTHEAGNAYAGFTFDTYNPQLPLVLLIGYLPMMGGVGAEGLDWSTILGRQTGSNGDSEFISAGTGAPNGDLIVAGSTTDPTFPVTTGVLPTNASYSVILGKFLYAPGVPADDARLEWMTHYGDVGNEQATVIHYSSFGADERVFVGGWTTSADWPLSPGTDPVDGTFYQGSIKGATDAFVLVVDPENGQQLRSTYYGGEGMEMITAVTEDEEGNVYFGGSTSSTTGNYGSNCTSPVTGFPMCSTETNDYQQPTNAGGTDAFIFRLDPDFNLTWSTFYGGAGTDLVYDAACLSLASEGNERIALVGSTTDAVPFGSTIGFQLTGNVPQSGFITTFDRDGVLKWGTNVHGLQRIEAVEARKTSFAVMGVTDRRALTQSTCSAVQGVLSICDPGNGAYQDDVITEYDTYFAEYLQPSGQLRWSTCYGDLGWLGAIYDDQFAGALL